MLKKQFSFILCFLLGWSTVFPSCAGTPVSISGMNEQQIRELYPDAKIIHVEEDEYPQIVEELRRSGYVEGYADNTHAIENLAYNSQHTATEKDRTQEQQAADDCNNNREDSASDASLRVIVDISGDIIHSGGSSSNGNEAAIVFIIIGTVLIVVWALYVFKYLYDISTGFKPCGKWYELSYSSSSIAHSPAQHIRFNGLRFMTGFRDGNTDVGVAFEAGETDILLSEINSLKLTGSYWLLGPVLRWRLSGGKNPHYFQMNFMAGSTEHVETDVIAKASLGLRFGFGDNFHLGFSWGVLNINLDDNQGLISDRDQYHYLYGINSGFRF